MARQRRRSHAGILTLLVPLALAGCSTKNKDVQIVVSSDDGAAAVERATHDRVGDNSNLVDEVKVYVRVNSKIGFNWSGSADDAERSAILETICSSPGIMTVTGREGANLCVPR